MQLVRRLKHNPLNSLFDEARLPEKIRRSLCFILLGNIMGNAHGIICGGGSEYRPADLVRHICSSIVPRRRNKAA